MEPRPVAACRKPPVRTIVGIAVPILFGFAPRSPSGPAGKSFPSVCRCLTLALPLLLEASCSSEVRPLSVAPDAANSWPS